MALRTAGRVWPLVTGVVVVGLAARRSADWILLTRVD